MSADAIPSSAWPKAFFAVTALLVALSVALVVQHFRHGWPFSLHHGLALDPEPRTSATESATREAQDEVPGAARVAVDIPPERLDALGVRFETVRFEDLGAEVRAIVTIVPDEARVSHVHTRVSGWIEQLRVSTTGAEVRAGQPLATIFSRELLASQTEYVGVLRATHTGTSPLLSGARQRLAVLGMTDGEIDALARRGAPLRTQVVSSPRAGTVLNRGVSAGTAVDPSTELFTIVDLSTLWAIAEIPESSIPDVRVGSTARIDVPAASISELESAVTFVYPTLTERTRTLRARFELPNADRALRPGMFGTATFTVDPGRVLTVSRDAVVDTGRHQHVFVRTADGMLDPRTVELGAAVGDRIAIVSGIADGEVVAASGVFIIDSESRMRGGSAMAPGHHGTTSTVDDTGGEPPPVTPGAPPDHSGHGQ